MKKPDSVFYLIGNQHQCLTIFNRYINNDRTFSSHTLNEVLTEKRYDKLLRTVQSLNDSNFTSLVLKVQKIKI